MTIVNKYPSRHFLVHNFAKKEIISNLYMSKFVFSLGHFYHFMYGEDLSHFIILQNYSVFYYPSR